MQALSYVLFVLNDFIQEEIFALLFEMKELAVNFVSRCLLAMIAHCVVLHINRDLLYVKTLQSLFRLVESHP